MNHQDAKYVPLSCVYEATLACNLKCRHCGSRAGRPRDDELSNEEAKVVFHDLARLGCRRITISGGEPTTRSDWIELIAAAAGAGLHVSMITNAVTFDRDAARQAKDSGLSAVGFSVDGPDSKVHDAIRGRVGHFERLKSAMRDSRKAELPFAVVTFLHRDNIHRLEETYEMIRSEGAFAWQVQLGTDMGNLKDNPELLVSPREIPRLQANLARLIKNGELRIDVSDSIGYYGPHEHVLRGFHQSRRPAGRFTGCPAGLRVVGIESNGNVKGCLSIMAGYNPKGAEYMEGNVRECSLVDIWNNPNAFSYNRKWKIEDLGGFCRSCENATICRGGCRAKMTASGGGLENPLCAYRITCENAPAKRAGYAAAALLLSSVLGAATQGCEEYGMSGPYDDRSRDTSTAKMDTDTNTDTETGTETVRYVLTGTSRRGPGD